MNPLVNLGLATCFIAAVPFDGTGEAWAQWGLAGVVVGVTLWRDWQREKRMSEALEKQQLWIRETLMNALNEQTEALGSIKGMARCPLAEARK